MQYSPKLKKAAEEIKSILDKYDIAAMVVLHTPGHSEYLIKINPSYSCAFIDGEMLRVRAKLQEHFNGDKKAWEKKVSDTANMLRLLSETSGHLTISVMEMSKIVDERVNAEHNGNGHTSHNQQNN